MFRLRAISLVSAGRFGFALIQVCRLQEVRRLVAERGSVPQCIEPTVCLFRFARGSLLGSGVKKRPRAMAAAPRTMAEEDAMGMRAAQAKMHGVVWIKQRRWPMFLPMACLFIGLLWILFSNLCVCHVSGDDRELKRRMGNTEGWRPHCMSLLHVYVGFR